MWIGFGLAALAMALLFLWMFWGRTTQVLIACGAASAGLLMMRYPTILSAMIGFAVVSYIASYLPGSTMGLLLFSGGIVVIRRLIMGDIGWRLGTIFVAASLFALWLATSGLWAESAYVYDWLHPIRIVVTVAVLADLVSTPQHYLAYFVGGAAGLVFTSILAIRTAYEFYVTGAAEQLAKHVAYVDSTRFFGNWPDPNIMSMTLTTFLGVTFAFWRSKLDYRLRWLGFAATALGFTAVLLSLSRSGLITCGIVTVLMLGVERRKARVILAVAAVTLAVVMIAPTDIFGRLVTLAGGDRSSSERLNLVLNGWNYFWDNPVTGGGPGSFAHRVVYDLTYLPHAFISHNTFVDLTVDTGLIGFVLYLIVMFLAYRGLDWKTWNIDHANPAHVINAGLRAGLVASSFSILTISSAAYIPFWALYTLCAMYSMTHLARNEHAAVATG